MKLNKTKVGFILRQYRKHAKTKEISRDVKCLSAEFNRSSSSIKKQVWTLSWVKKLVAPLSPMIKKNQN